MKEKDGDWQLLLTEINSNLEAERKLLKKKLQQKIDDIRVFKEELNKTKSLNLSINTAREDRIRSLELKLEEERNKSSMCKTKNDALNEEVRINSIRLDQLERENANLRIEIKNKVMQINQLRMEVLPRYGVSKKSAGYRKLDRLEDSMKDTEDFYRAMSQKIDKILRY